MRNVGNKFSLAFAGVVQLACHIIHRSGKVTDFIVGFDRDLVVQVAGGIFICSVYDAADRKIYYKCKCNQYDQRKSQDHSQCDVGTVENGIFLRFQFVLFIMDCNVAFRDVVGCDRCDHTEHIFIKIVKKATGLIIIAGQGYRIKRIQLRDL